MNIFKTMSYRSYGEQKAFMAMMISMHGVDKLKTIINQMVRTSLLTDFTANNYLRMINLVSTKTFARKQVGAKKHV